MEQYDISAIGQLLSAVGDGAGGILLSVAELIAERDLRRLEEYGYVGPRPVSAGLSSPSVSIFDGPGLLVSRPVTSIKSSVTSDPRPVHPSVPLPVSADDVPDTAVTTGQQ